MVYLGAQGQSRSQEQSDHLGQTSTNCLPPSQLPTYPMQIGPDPALLELSSFAVPFFKESHKSLGFSLAIFELHTTDSVNFAHHPKSLSSYGFVQMYTNIALPHP